MSEKFSTRIVVTPDAAHEDLTELLNDAARYAHAEPVTPWEFVTAQPWPSDPPGEERVYSCQAEKQTGYASTGSIGTEYVHPSLEEVVNLAAEHEARKMEKARRLREFTDAFAKLDITDEVERAVLDLHSPDIDDACDGCSGYETCWPCRTVYLIAGRHGLHLAHE